METENSRRESDGHDSEITSNAILAGINWLHPESPLPTNNIPEEIQPIISISDESIEHFRQRLLDQTRNAPYFPNENLENEPQGGERPLSSARRITHFSTMTDDEKKQAGWTEGQENNEQEAHLNI